MILFMVLTAVTFSLFGFIIGIWADGFEKLQIVPLMVVTPLTFLGGSFYSINMLPPFWAKAALFNPVVYLVSGFRWSFYGVSDAFFIKACFDKPYKRLQRFRPLGAYGDDVQLGAGAGGQHHQAHDRSSADRLAVMRHRYGGVVAFRAFDELRRGARVQSLDVANGDDSFGSQAVGELRHLSSHTISRQKALGSRP
jgi:hypothetical protein